MDLLLDELRERGQGRNIFPPRAYFALQIRVQSALLMGHFLHQRFTCDLNGAAVEAKKLWVFLIPDSLS